MPFVPSEPLPIFSEPTSFTTAGPFTLSATARYLVRWNITTPGAVMTISNNRSHLIQNEGTVAASVNTTGNSSQTLLAGESLMVIWDTSQTKHELQLFRATKATVLNGQYTVTSGDITAAQCTLPGWATCTSASWQCDGLTGGTADATLSFTTGVLNWSGKNLAGRVIAGSTITFQCQLA